MPYLLWEDNTAGIKGADCAEDWDHEKGALECFEANFERFLSKLLLYK